MLIVGFFCGTSPLLEQQWREDGAKQEKNSEPDRLYPSKAETDPPPPPSLPALLTPADAQSTGNVRACDKPLLVYLKKEHEHTQGPNNCLDWPR